MEPKKSLKQTSTDPSDKNENNSDILIKFPNGIIDLVELSKKEYITNSEFILSILEVCSFPQKYNYACSNNTKSFWDIVKCEQTLKKIFKNYGSETIRRYWKIIRSCGDAIKFAEVIEENKEYIDNMPIKIMTLINGISYFIKMDKKDFKDFFNVFNSKDKKSLFTKRVEAQEYSINLNNKKRKRASSDNDSIISEKKQNIIQTKKDDIIQDNFEFMKKKLSKIVDYYNNNIEKLMQFTDSNEFDTVQALYGTSGDCNHAYLYLIDKEQNQKYYFTNNDDDTILNKKNIMEYIKLIEKKGKELVDKRTIFLNK